MAKVADFIVDSIENFFNSEDFLRYIMLGETLMDYHITDPLLIEKGFLGFRITKCERKDRYKKLYVYVNTDYFLNMDLVFKDYNCLLILLESGMRDITEFYIPYNTKIQANKSSKLKLNNSVFYFDSVSDFKSFSVSILNSVIHIKNVLSLEEFKQIEMISNSSRNRIVIDNFRLYIEASKYWYHESVSYFTKVLNEYYTYMEDSLLKHNIQNMEIAFFVNDDNCLFSLYKILFNHYSDLSLGHISLKDKGITMNLYILESVYERYLNRKKFQDFRPAIDDYLFEWYHNINICVLESLKEILLDYKGIPVI